LWPPPVPAPVTALQQAYLHKLRHATTSDYPILPYKASNLPVYTRGKVIGFDAKGKPLVKSHGVAAPMCMKKAQRFAAAPGTATGTATLIAAKADVEDMDKEPQKPQPPPGSASRARPGNQRTVHM